MKVGDLVRHYRSQDIGVLVAIEVPCDLPTRWKVAWGKCGTVCWIYNEDMLEVISESR